MNYQIFPSDQADRKWEYIKPLVPAAKLGGRSRTTDMRLVLNAIFLCHPYRLPVALPAA
jgi:putative transposase